MNGWKRGAGDGIWRKTSDGGEVGIRPLWDGGVRITVGRMAAPDGPYEYTHSRTVRWIDPYKRGSELWTRARSEVSTF